jgi:glycosyltransferase involved in cell wall biosynthesis
VRIGVAYPFNDSDWLGGRNYFSSLFSAVRIAAPDDVDFVLFMGAKTATTLPEEFPFIEVVRSSMMDRRSPAWLMRQLARLPRRLTTDPLLARLLRRHRIDLFSHSGALGPGAGVKAIGWLPDFQFLHYPDYWTPKQLADMRRIYGAACMHCDGLIVSSRAALNDLASFAPQCRIPKHILHFVPIPYDVQKLRPKAEVLAQYGLPEVYFHVPNQFWAHKNHRVVIEALALLKQQGMTTAVVCTGNPADIRRPGHVESLIARCRELGIDKDFRVLGIVPYSDMQSLMAHSCAVINPSRFEGWSTSVEEAKAFDKRVLLSDIPVHREQAPRLARYFGLDDAAGLAALMHRCVDEVPPSASPLELRRANLQAAAEFGKAYLQVVRGSLPSPVA